MKARLIVLAILALAFIPLLGGCINDNTIIGVWLLEYDWDPAGSPGTVNIEFYPDHTFESSSGGYGVWTRSGSSIRWEYDSEWDTTYIGTVDSSGTYMSGTMSNTEPASGTWQATKGAGTLTKSPGEVSDSGR